MWTLVQNLENENASHVYFIELVSSTPRLHLWWFSNQFFKVLYVLKEGKFKVVFTITVHDMHNTVVYKRKQ